MRNAFNDFSKAWLFNWIISLVRNTKLFVQYTHTQDVEI